jgi:hypothetical protein
MIAETHTILQPAIELVEIHCMRCGYSYTHEGAVELGMLQAASCPVCTELDLHWHLAVDARRAAGMTDEAILEWARNLLERG